MAFMAPRDTLTPFKSLGPIVFLDLTVSVARTMPVAKCKHNPGQLRDLRS